MGSEFNIYGCDCIVCFTFNTDFTHAKHPKKLSQFLSTLNSIQFNFNSILLKITSWPRAKLCILLQYHTNLKALKLHWKEYKTNNIITLPST